MLPLLQPQLEHERRQAAAFSSWKLTGGVQLQNPAYHLLRVLVQGDPQGSSQGQLLMLELLDGSGEVCQPANVGYNENLMMQQNVLHLS